MKARTRAQKLRSKRGRALLPPSDREPNGRKSRRSASKQEQENEMQQSTLATARSQRAKLLTAQMFRALDADAALDPRLGYALGRLRLLGIISEPQFEAGSRYAQDIVRDLKLSGLSIASPRAQNIFAVHGKESNEEGQDRAEQAKQARHKRNTLRDLLLATGDINTGRRVLSIVYGVCVLDEDCRAHDGLLLARGLNRLARHYGA